MKFVLVFLILLTSVGAAADDFTNDYRVKKRQITGQADRCDLIGARDILSLAGVPLDKMAENSEQIKTLFETTRQQRAKCYDEVLTKLDELIGLGQAELEKDANQTTLLRQNEVDQSLLSLLKTRRTLTLRLLNAMQGDISRSLQTMDAEAEAPQYYDESPYTHSLVKEDMALVMETERRQIAVDELALLLQGPQSFRHFAAIKLSKAHHFLSQALLIFEDAYEGDKLLSAARLKSELAYANGQVMEALAHPRIGKESKEKFGTLSRRLRGMEQVVGIAHDDLARGLFNEDWGQWLSVVYEDLSTLTGAVLQLIQDVESDG